MPEEAEDDLTVAMQCADQASVCSLLQVQCVSKSEKMRALQHSISFTSVDCVRLVLRHGVSVNQRLPHNNTLLIIAAEADRCDLVSCCLEDGAHPNLANRSGMTALAVACKAGSMQCSKALIEAGARVNPPDQRKRTPLFYAISHGHLELVEFLVSKGADEVFRKPTCTALTLAISERQVNIATFLIQRRSHVNTPVRNGDRPLMIALKKGLPDIVLQLIHNEAQLDALCLKGRTFLMEAAVLGSMDMCQLLVENGASLNVQDAQGNTALSLACYEGRTPIVRLLLKAGANPDLPNWLGLTPLIVAAGQGHVDELRLLVARECQLDIKDSKLGQTALHWACKHTCVDVVKVIVGAGALLDVKDNAQFSPLCVAAQYDNADVLDYLLYCGCQIEAQQPYSKNTALSIAAQFNATQAIARLLLRGANVDHKNAKLESPLMIVCLQVPHHPSLELLLRAGADVNMCDFKNDPPVLAALRSSQYMSNPDAMVSLMKARPVLGKALPSFLYRNSTRLHPVEQTTLFNCPLYPSATSLRGFGETCGLWTPCMVVLVNGQYNIFAHFAKNWFFHHSDLLHLSKMVGERRNKSSRLIKGLFSQPWTLGSLSFVAVSTMLGCGPDRPDRVAALGLPPLLQRWLLFKSISQFEPDSQLETNNGFSDEDAWQNVFHYVHCTK